MQTFLARLCGGADLAVEEAEAATRVIMAGEATPAQMGAFLAALRCRGETVEEIVGCARAMRAFATAVPSRHPLLVDTCGTGGDGAGTFNISTAAAFVVSGAGLPVAKHGNRAASSRAGSADVLEALGVRIELEPAEVTRCLDEVGIAFLFAKRHHPAMRHVAQVRSDLGVRTIFNLLGPLCNPAGAQVQVIGVPDAGLVGKVAAAALHLGTRRTLVVHGTDGLDEISLSAPTLVADVVVGEAEPRFWEITPEEAGLERAGPDSLRGGSAQDNAAIIAAVLGGERGPRRDVVCLNAAAALLAAGAVPQLAAGVALAQRVIDDGRALQRLQALRAATQRTGEGGPA